MDGESKIIVARKLAGDILMSDLDKICLERFDFKRLEKLLFDYADFLREFKISNGNTFKALKYAEAVTWNLDVYLRKNISVSSINLDDLEIRIDKLKEQIEAFEEI